MSPGPAHALILAAGQSQRFGGGKLLAMFRGRPLLAHVLDLVQSGRDEGLLENGAVVVAGGDEESQRLSEKAGLDVILNHQPDRGLSHSLRLGLTRLERPSGSPGAAVIFLADQPLVRLDVVRTMIAAWRAGAGGVVRPRYGARPEVPGHPVLVDRSIWPLVHQLQGDRGLAGLPAATAIPTAFLGFPGDNPDVDTPADLQALEEPTR